MRNFKPTKEQKEAILTVGKMLFVNCPVDETTELVQCDNCPYLTFCELSFFNPDLAFSKFNLAFDSKKKEIFLKHI